MGTRNRHVQRTFSTREHPTLLDYVQDFENFVSQSGSINDKLQNSLAIQSDLIEYFTNEIIPAAADREEMLYHRSMSNLAYNVPEVSTYFTDSIRKTIDGAYDWTINELERLNQSEEWNNLYYQTKKQHQETVESASINFCKRHDCEVSLEKIYQIFMFQIARFGGDTYWKTTSKVVFVGFGESEITPRLIDMTVGTSIFDGAFTAPDDHYIRPRVDFEDSGELIDESEKNSVGKTWSGSAMLTPYAMMREIQNTLNGIHWNNERILTIQMPKFMQERLEKEIFAHLKNTDGVGAATLSKVEKVFENSKKEIEKAIREEVRSAINAGKRSRREKFRYVTSQIPLDEMANFARLLVSIEAQIQHYSEDRRHAGGPIDVATITKEDGFLWVDTKQSVDPSKNPRQLEHSKHSAGLH